MHPFDEMKAWIGFGEEDIANLAMLLPHAEPHLTELSEVFYERILANPAAANVLSGPEQVQRLKGTLRVWARELLAGPHDIAYFDRRQRIGRRHVDVGLSARYMFLAMSVYRERLCDIAHRVFPAPVAHGVCAAVGKVCDLDLATMTTTYVRGREERQFGTLQEVVVSNLRTSAFVLDAQGCIIAATPSTGAILALQDPLGVGWQRALRPEVLADEAFTQLIRDALGGHQSPGLPKFFVRQASGTRQYRASVATLDNPVARVLVQMDDITESIEAEARLQRAESLANIGALSAAVAHELRNPLAGISGAVQVISRSMPQDDRRKPIMEKVEQQVRRLDALVSDLLAYARPTAPDLAAVDLAEACRSVVELVGREYEACALSVEGDGTGEADVGLLQQILLNLVQNAIQAQEGTGRVVMRVSTGCIDVLDEGPGVPEADIERIFAAFYTTRAKGTGLGLAISRKYAHAMHGTVEVLRGAHRGGAFRLTLGGQASVPRPPTADTSPSDTEARSG